MPPLDDVEAVFWDIGGVILDLESVRRAHREFVSNLVNVHDLGMSTDEALATWRGTVGDYFRERDGTAFRPAREAYARGVESIVGEAIPRSAWLPQFRSVVDASVRPVPGAPAAIERLATAAEVRHQGIVSDIDADEGRRILETLGIRQHLDAVTTSEDVGRTKPDPAMFETALAAAGVEPARAVMVGDRYDHDMAGAAEHGIVTVAHGAEDGPAVDHRIETPHGLLSLLGVDGPADATESV